MRGRVIDVLLVLWAIPTTLLVAALTPERPRDLDLLGAALIAVLHLPLLLRDRRPERALIATTLVALVYLTLEYAHTVVTFSIIICVYSLWARRARRIAVPLSLWATIVLLYAQRVIERPVSVVAGAMVAMVFLAGAMFMGDRTRLIWLRNRQLAQLTERLRREQEERARQAVALEQSRIARELHDVVAHHMTVISVQAGAGRYAFDADPETARSTLDLVAGTARQGLQEMRRMLSLLRVTADDADTGSEEPYTQVLGLAQLPELLERVRVAGATVSFTSTGSPVPLNPGTNLCVYRVIQESLTNVIKHADPPHATVELCWRPEQLVARVTDQGRSREQPGCDESDGCEGRGHHGLVGMRERARLYGGVLHTGPLAGGGFEVRLTLPLPEPVG